MDDDPVWSPDGNQIALVRVGGDSAITPGVRRSSLMVMDSDGADQHAVVTSEEANGSPAAPSWQRVGWLARQVGRGHQRRP
jgi:Tol biopolymer transport system component